MKSKTHRIRARPKELFSPTASRVARAFLRDPDQHWMQKWIVESCKLSAAHVSGICKEMERRGFVTREGDFWKLKHGNALLAEWVRFYRFTHNRLYRFRLPSHLSIRYFEESEADFFSQFLSCMGNALQSTWAFTLLQSFIGADSKKLKPRGFKRPFSIYVYLSVPLIPKSTYQISTLEHSQAHESDIPPPADDAEDEITIENFARKIGLIPQYMASDNRLESRGNVTFMVPYDDVGTFYGTRTAFLADSWDEFEDFPCVSPLQLYLDLFSYAQLNGEISSLNPDLSYLREMILGMPF